MMDDAMLERGLRARPPADPTYVSRIGAMPPTTDRPDATPGRDGTPVGRRSAPSLSWLLAVLAIVALAPGAFLFLNRQPAHVGPAASPSSRPTAAPTPSPSSAPEASTSAASPSPRAFEGFVTREVAPGVHRIDNDGVRALAWNPRSGMAPFCCHYARSIGVGPDGAVWLLRPDSYFRLGGGRSHQFDGVISERINDLIVTGIGEATRLWRLEQGSVLSTAPAEDGDAWLEDGQGMYLAAAPDGRVWAVDQDGEGVRVWRGGEGGWTSLAAPVWPASDGSRIAGLWADDMGSVWLSRGTGLVRSVNDGWSDLQLPSGQAIAADVGSDGTVWVWTGDTWARNAADSWATLGLDTLPALARVGGHSIDPVVAPDGSLWYPPDHPWRGCDGLARFDGLTLTRYLGSLCVYGLEVAPDGTAWALAGEDYRADPRASVEVYAIRPEARMPG